LKNYIPKATVVDPDAILEAPVRFFGKCRVFKRCRIGQFTFLNDRTTLFPYTTVGRYCSIGKSCEIGAPSHPNDWLTSSPVAFGLARHFPDEKGMFPQALYQPYRPTTIGSDVWIGSLVLVNAGVRIGHGAIIGAGAVVTADVEPYAIVAGAPARTIRYRFKKSTIDRLLATQWWTLSPDEVAKLNLTDAVKSIEALEAK
jgi:acetyltransferase-like isoleucine patch superfamily enzyme